MSTIARTVLFAAVAAVGLAMPALADDPGGDQPVDLCLTQDTSTICINHVDADGDAWMIVEYASVHPDLGPLPLPEGTEFRVTGTACDDCVQAFCGTFEGFIFDAVLVPCMDGDADANGEVDVMDLVSVILAWGDCADANACGADLTRDGSVDVADLVEVVLNF